MAKSTSGLLFEAATVGGLLEIPLTSSARVAAPRPGPGEIVVYYGGWSLVQIALSAVGMQHMFHCDWTEDFQQRAEAGYYRLSFPKLKRANWSQQRNSLPPGWSPAPLCVALTACIVHIATTGKHLIGGTFFRCAEPIAEAEAHLAVHLFWGDALLGVSGVADRSGGDISMVAVRKV